MTKKFSYTIQMLTFGEESNKHIAAEIQANVRPANWNVAGHPENAQWKEILKARQATPFNPALPTFGYARVYMPQGVGIGAYIPTAAAPIAAAPAFVPALDTAAAVAATFAQPVPTTIPVAAPIAAPATGGFVVAPAGV